MPGCSKRGPSQELRLMPGLAISSLTRTPFPQGYLNTAGRDSSFNSPSHGWRQASLYHCSGVLYRGKEGSQVGPLWPVEKY